MLGPSSASVTNNGAHILIRKAGIMDRVEAWIAEIKVLDAQVAQIQVRKASLVASIRAAGRSTKGMAEVSTTKRSRRSNDP
jgi:hypothetical protein